jgi:hypothetical protein
MLIIAQYYLSRLVDRFLSEKNYPKAPETYAKAASFYDLGSMGTLYTGYHELFSIDPKLWLNNPQVPGNKAEVQKWYSSSMNLREAEKIVEKRVKY